MTSVYIKKTYTLIFTTSYCLQCHLEMFACSHATSVVVPLNT